MTDDIDLEMMEEMMEEMGIGEQPSPSPEPTSSEQAPKMAKPSRFSGWKSKSKIVPDNIVVEGEARTESVPSGSADKLLECEACDNKVKALHKLKSANGKVSNLCKTCYDKELELPPIVPGDAGQPQNVVEQIIEADRRFGRKVIDNAIVKETEKALNSEKLLTEDLLEGLMDPARFKEVFMNVINQECIGKNLAEIEESIRRDHEMLFDKRAGIQAKLSFRTELLKSESAETRAKALKEDWLVKPLKQKAAASRSKAESKPKAKVDPIESMRKSLLAQGMSPEKVEKKIKAFQGLD